MLVSYNWLKQHVDLPKKLTPEELALRLTMSTVEVEGVNNQAKDLDNIVVGEIIKIKKHPNADMLKLVLVNVGKENLNIVCGGSNLKEGMKVALGKIGAKVKWHGEGELIELVKAKIRGEESYGMICASSEIGLSGLYPANSDKEVIDLGKIKVKNGTPLSEVIKLDDVIFDIDNKSMTHRPDLWGHYGLAREIGALYGAEVGKYEPPAVKEQKAKNKEQSFKLKVDVKDTELCPRYMAVVIDNVKIGSSPEWMQKLLMSVGLRPINNIVDITNYLLYDLGQPMHAFDAEQIVDNKKQITIEVRKAKNGEKFTALDEKEHELTSEMLVIANKKQAVALAGIMGGENSGVTDETTTIVFESANFDATNIRRTATALGMRTESSSRFEKSLDPNNAELALRRAVQLTLEVCPGARIVSNVVDESKFRQSTGLIELPFEFLNKKIGIELDKQEVVRILKSLGFGVEEKKDKFLVKIPTWRATKDITIVEDLVEEVSRIYGYDNIAGSLPSFPVIPPERNELRNLERRIKQIVALEFGFTESYNYSFVSPQLLKKIGIHEEHIELDNPIDKSRPLLRRSLLPNLLENVEQNAHNFDEVRLFEVGKVFWKNEPGERMNKSGDDLLPRQDVMLGIVFVKKGESVPFFQVSSAMQNLLMQLGCECKLQAKIFDPWIHPGRSAEVIVQDEHLVGAVMELAPVRQKEIGIDSRVAMAEINLSDLLEYIKDKNTYNKVALFPPVMRDIAFVVSGETEYSSVEEVIKKVDPLILEVELFDVFQGKNIEAGKKSMAFHIVYQSIEKTLESGDVDKIHEKVESVLKKKFDASLRK
ncbi:phenylalanine--tRNA ligase subunit beta [Patescibacteria group bacterium]|nr:phenylalanine--tRNA ligase subunit beta [Patescibacteria group bacterium]MBU1895874.1 phenylalanine--tRNA ligase subunit beta [Patescibacteria group bacterium]